MHDRPEGTSWILLAPWGRAYAAAWDAYEAGLRDRPRLIDFMQRGSKAGGSTTSTTPIDKGMTRADDSPSGSRGIRLS